MCNAVDMAIFVLKKYYRLSEAASAYSAALLLDPSKRRAYMKQTWKSDEMTKAVERVRLIWEAQYKNLPSPSESQRQVSSRPTNKKGKERA
jgi:hypothetical protein